jgi:very-short-patch-repair endonuclease
MSRTARFAEFLRAAVAIKTQAVTEVNKYPTVIWFSNLPTGLSEVRSPLLQSDWPREDLRWLVVSRLPEPDRPSPPDVCAPWLAGVVLDEPGSPPDLNSQYSAKDEYGQVIAVSPEDDVVHQWDRYVTQEWTKWAKKAAVCRTVKPFYQKLFAAREQLKGREDAYDLYIGIGLLDSRTDSAKRLHRHLFAFPAELMLDERSGALAVAPSADFVALKADLDFLPPSDRARLQPQLEMLSDKFGELGPALNDRLAVAELLTQLVHSLDGGSEYIDDLSPQDAPPGRMRASFAPALILRPKNTRSLDELLARIQADASGTEPKVAVEDMPTAWRRMMEDSRVWGGEVGTAVSKSREEVSERSYFPLPSNEEQSRIVRFAYESAGVVVQGPPGTGKSHTIANLISHYLATGRRVLVTAQTAQALKVLRDKLPSELQKLCVSLLGDTRTSDEELQRSVNGILARLQEFDVASYEHRISRFEQAINEGEIRLKGLEQTLRESRAAETEVLDPVFGYRGTRAHIARCLRDERTRFAWMQDDQISHHSPCPTFASGWTGLAVYHCKLDGQLRERLDRQMVTLPFGEQDAVEVVKRIALAKAEMPSGSPSKQVPELPASLSSDGLRAAEIWLEKLQKAELEAADDRSWAAELRETLLNGSLVTWRTLSEEASETTARLTDEAISNIVEVDVSGRSTSEARRDLAKLIAHYEAGGKRRILFFIKPQVINQTEWVERQVRIQGSPVDSFEEMGRALRSLEASACLDAAWAVWTRWPSTPANSPRQQAAVLRHRRKLLDGLLCLADEGKSFSADMRSWLNQTLISGIETADQLIAIRRKLAELELRKARTERDELVRSLRQAIANRDAVPAAYELLDWLIKEDGDRVAVALSCLNEERATRELHQRYEDFLISVRHVAPKLANNIVRGEGTEEWQARFADFELAWQHKCAQSWLDLILSNERVEATHRAARDQKQELQEILSQLTSERAWLRSLERIDDLRRASLKAWAKEVSSIPASGLSVFRRRAVAQGFLRRCLEAIPAWVVSMDRLYETVEAKPGLFDVAIVDEASQCWLDSLVLFYLAKQVIVVGDDKQISPTRGFASDGQIEQLASAFMPDFEFRGSFTIDSSLFDHAQRILSAAVPLREHFRCVPEIIQFSNELCYAENPLIPLRQVGKNRLEPLKTTYLANGIRRGDINDAEADAIVAAIEKCHRDPAYEEMEFGVICLQGDAQAARIQNLLVERLGPAVFSQRNLRCGNAYAFQGDERDVMFLSMVVAPNTKNATLSTLMYQRSFNVAMSRARDQAWLFHSVQENDLGPQCLRRRVLAFFKQPPDLSINGSSVDIPTLQVAAKRADRMAERPPRPFDSWFEVDVALALSIRGYKLSTQVEVAKKRIDLVIEGEEGVRLAVECDGEAWHGPEQYESDLFRQRQLERAEWRFVRVRESLFYSDETKAIGEVIEECEELGIAPHRRHAPPPETSMLHTISQNSPAADQSPSIEPDESDDFLESLEAQEDEPEPMESGSDLSFVQGTLWQATARDDRMGPFTGYGAKHYPDPRTSPTSNVREAVLDIVTTDGPLPKESLYRLYKQGCPKVERAGKSLSEAVNRAVYSLERSGLLVTRDEGTGRRPSEVVVKLLQQKWVESRLPGARSLEDVPISELGLLMYDASLGVVPESDHARIRLYREVAKQYGVKRLMAKAIQRFRLAERVAYSSETRSGT